MAARATYIWATLIYVALAAIHLYLTYRAWRMEEKDPSFSEIVKNNLVLGTLFLTASVSFITYFSTGTTCFSIVTILWLMEATLLAKLSFVWKGYEQILRRYSYLSLILASAQLLFVIPTMEGNVNLAISRFIINVIAGAFFANYFVMLYNNRTTNGKEEEYAMTTSLLASMAVLASLVISFSPGLIGLVISCGILAFLSLRVSLTSFKEYENYFRRFSYGILGYSAWALVQHIPAAFHESALQHMSHFLAWIAAAVIYGAYFLNLHRVDSSLNREMRLASHGALIVSLLSITAVIYIYTPSLMVREILLIALSFASLYGGRSLFGDFGRTFTRFSFALLFLASTGIPQAIPFSAPGTLNVFSAAFGLLILFGAVYYSYFLSLYRDRAATGKEDDCYMFLSLTTSLVLAGYTLFHLGRGGLYLEIAGTITSLIIIFTSFKYHEVMKGIHNFGFLGLMGITIAVLFNSSATAPHAMNPGLPALLVIAGLFYLAGRMLQKHEMLLAKDEKWTIPAVTCFIAIILIKATLLQTTGSVSTLIWALMGLGTLWYVQKHNGNEKYMTLSQVLFFIAFIKSIVFDANFACFDGRIALSSLGSVALGEYLVIFALIACFGQAARFVWQSYDLRNLLLSMALFIFCFQFSFVLYRYYGVLDCFQVILSGFWSIFALLFIQFGIAKELKIFRQFGLLLLVSSILKICFVDLWVLAAYNKVTTFIIIGVLLMITSFMYQKNRATIAERIPGKRLVSDAA
jgi:hypothetical protein